jgi:hypothetical protein
MDVHHASQDRVRQIAIVRRAFVEFLTVPTIVIVSFLILAAITFMLMTPALASKARPLDKGPRASLEMRRQRAIFLA